MTALKAMRIRRKITQIELARRLNVTRSSVSHNEKRGIRGVKTAEIYAAILMCRPEELMSFQPSADESGGGRSAHELQTSPRSAWNDIA